MTAATNFDIYLPEWLARNNKQIFDSDAAAVLFLLAVRLHSPMAEKTNESTNIP